MGKFCTSVLCAVIFISVIALAQAAPEKAAEDSATQWLALVDAGDYAASWDDAAALFKNAVPKEQWTEKAKVARGPFGKVNSRKLKSATFKTTLPGAPDGQYVIIQYDSTFEHKQSAVETVTPMLDKDGQWRVSGYFIR